MENHVLARLERVSESIATKSEKLQKLKGRIRENDHAIESLNNEKLVLGSSTRIDYTLASETAKIEEYQSWSKLLEKSIDQAELSACRNKEKHDTLLAQVRETLNRCNEEIITMESYCKQIEENINLIQEKNLMSTEDVLSTMDQKEESSRASKTSTKVIWLKKLIASTQQQRIAAEIELKAAEELAVEDSIVYH